MKPPVPPEAEILKIVAVVDVMPLNTGNHELFKLYKEAGGTAAWKSFRRGVALYRGGVEAEVEAERIAEETDQAARMAKLHEERELEREQKKEREMARKKRKEEEMARREELSRGQRVFVRVMYSGHLKLRPATVIAVMRGAVNVKIDDDDEPRTVRFNEVETSATPAQQAQQMSPAQAQIEVAYRRGHHVAPEPREPQPLTAVPPAFVALAKKPQEPQQEPPPRPLVTDSAAKRTEAAPPPAPAPSSKLDTIGQVNAWIEQGAAMREGLAAQAAALKAGMDDLAAEALRIEEAIVAKRAELQRITSLLAALDQMRAVAA